MALRLVKALRYRLPFLPTQTGRIRITQDHEVADEVPHDYYTVKDYERNPYYNAPHYAQRPGFKKGFDYFNKTAERREVMWWPTYRYQLFDLGLSWTTLVLVALLPVQMWILFCWETRCRKFQIDPLSFGGQRPIEH